MTAKITELFLFLLVTSLGFAQGHIDDVKRQDYLRYKDMVDCNNPDGDNLTARICANLAFQKSDSLLTVAYNKILDGAKKKGRDGLKTKIVALQKAWRSFRDEHCSIIYDSFEECGGCHQRSISYLTCLKELTDNRTKELIALDTELYGGQ